MFGDIPDWMAAWADRNSPWLPSTGYKSCRAVSSGGHGWAEIDGDVYDVEWTRVTGYRYFAFPYSKSGSGAPAYASNRTYVVQIAPHRTRW